MDPQQAILPEVSEYGRGVTPQCPNHHLIQALSIYSAYKYLFVRWSQASKHLSADYMDAFVSSRVVLVPCEEQVPWLMSALQDISTVQGYTEGSWRWSGVEARFYERGVDFKVKSRNIDQFYIYISAHGGAIVPEVCCVWTASRDNSRETWDNKRDLVVH